MCHEDQVSALHLYARFFYIYSSLLPCLTSSIFSLFDFTHKTPGCVLPKSKPSSVILLQCLLLRSLMRPQHSKKGWLMAWREPCHGPYDKAHTHALGSQARGNHLQHWSSLFFCSSKNVSFVSWVAQNSRGSCQPLQQSLTAIVTTRKNIFWFSISQIHLKYFHHFTSHSFTIQPFQVRRTETQICDLHISCSLDVCIWSHLRDLNSILLTPNSPPETTGNWKKLTFKLYVLPIGARCHPLLSCCGQTLHHKRNCARGPCDEEQPGWQTYAQLTLRRCRVPVEAGPGREVP